VLHPGRPDAARLQGELKRAYLAGATYRIADIMTWPWIDTAVTKLGMTLDAAPHLARWARAIDGRPAVRRGLQVSLRRAA
jgi:GST-like protein